MQTLLSTLLILLVLTAAVFAQDIEPEPEPKVIQPDRLARVGAMEVITYFEYKVPVPEHEFVQAQRVWRLRAAMGAWFNPPPSRTRIIRHYLRFPRHEVTVHFDDDSTFTYAVSFELFNNLSAGDLVKCLYNEDGPVGFVKI